MVSFDFYVYIYIYNINVLAIVNVDFTLLLKYNHFVYTSEVVHCFLIPHRLNNYIVILANEINNSS